MTVMPVMQIAAVDPPSEIQRPSVPSDTPVEVAGEKKESKKVTQENIVQMLKEFNAQLDALCSHFDIKITEEDMKICPLANVDHLLSFETKVGYVTEFFEEKNLSRLTEKILGSK